MIRSLNVFKGVVLSYLLFILPTIAFSQLKISPYLLGENAWSPKGVLQVQNLIKNVNFQTVRIGGNGYENAEFIYKDAIKLIAFVRAVGAEPILQMPRQFKDGDKAYHAIAYINGKMDQHIKFWCIGNEPDHHNQLASPEEVYDYFSKISTQIKRYDSHAKILGFDLSSYQPKYLNRLLGGNLDLTGRIPHHDYYYLDVLSFHGYRFADIAMFEGQVKELKSVLSVLNKKRDTGNPLGWAITEFNSHWKLDASLGANYSPYNFHNGQIFAEMFDLGMREGAFTICPWSMLEGGAHRSGTDLSLFDELNGKYMPRSNYYHTQLLAQNFKENYLQHSPNAKGLTIIPMGDENGLAIMVLNKNETERQAYVFKLRREQKEDNSTVYINANLDQVYKGEILAATTQMILFDSKGQATKIITYSAKDAYAMTSPVEKDL
ncbi:hypothetical protein ADIARSV_1724 [Arcticibacter svalbardensis MN12-7]|uniref:Uncharacterized protein n=1 Tax=Arcticibacter svalbardensis MN12-7 TaxID=1150600 RepID=R9GU51_9SPHI|nr:hypothetical protein [Arcticibacter svalbardensis]EOR95236.1 hypothetical protein ADIARSV_1724 [Arcticibacter svalbardensis MN12-7]